MAEPGLGLTGDWVVWADWDRGRPFVALGLSCVPEVGRELAPRLLELLPSDGRGVGSVQGSGGAPCSGRGPRVEQEGSPGASTNWPPRGFLRGTAWVCTLKHSLNVVRELCGIS